MNLGDPELELIDPTPNVHSLFVHFDNLFFWAKLASRAVVRWSKRMYTCAGTCSYGGRGGICDIALSEPLLKLRSRKDLVETLLHEMIHAYLFITSRDQDRDGHGPNFKAHMHRINRFAGINITIYHDFHDEVQLYQTHWWRCNGPCQSRRPHFGIVRRTCNKAPGPSDYWWRDHKARCGGTFIKIKEPEKPGKKTAATKTTNNPITKYINNNNNNMLNKNIQNLPTSKPVLKVTSNVPPKQTSQTKPKGISSVVSTKRDNIIFNPTPNVVKVFTGIGQTIDGTRSRTQSASAAETVRDIWAKKQFPTSNINRPRSSIVSATNNNNLPNINKNKRSPTDLVSSSPSKIKKIDDYFKDKASSILKDVYGQDFNIIQPKDSSKLVIAVTAKKLVFCPVCNARVQDDIINTHLDECLNKDVIEKLSKESINPANPVITTQQNKNNSKQIVIHTPAIPKYEEIHDVSKFKIENKDIKLEIPDAINLSFMDELIPSKPDKGKGKGKTSRIDNNVVKAVVKNEGTEVKLSNEVLSKLDDFIEQKLNEKERELQEILMSKGQKCLCCNKQVFKPMADHLEECLKFFANDDTIPDEGASTSMNNAIIIDDDEDIFDETLTMNPTGTKTPCPCCLQMVELDNMNEHLDECLQ